eukprot:10003939-Lingulodinium_polyedra.AAC.1
MECATRAIRAPLRRWTVDWTASLCTVSKAVLNDAAESAVRRCSGSPYRTPRALYANTNKWCSHG